MQLGRDIPLPVGAAELIIPGLAQLLSQIQSSHVNHPLAPTLLTIRWLVDVWLQVLVWLVQTLLSESGSIFMLQLKKCALQDAVLKAQKYGMGYVNLFPRILLQVATLPGFAKFQSAVLVADQKQKAQASSNQYFKGDPTGKTVDLSWVVEFG